MTHSSRKQASIAAVAGMMVLAAVTAALAHHSPVVFDRTQKIELSGTVTEFRWMNPHSWIHLDVPNEQGQVENWSVEMGSPNHLVKGGWKRTTLAVGQKITVQAYPLRNGELGGQFISLTLEDGHVMTENGPEGVVD